MSLLIKKLLIDRRLLPSSFRRNCCSFEKYAFLSFSSTPFFSYLFFYLPSLFFLTFFPIHFFFLPRFFFYFFFYFVFVFVLLLLICCFMYLPLFVGVLCWSLFWYALLCVLYSFAIIWMRKRELVSLPCLMSCYCYNVLWLFLTVQWVGMQCVIVVYPDHTP